MNQRVRFSRLLPFLVLTLAVGLPAMSAAEEPDTTVAPVPASEPATPDADATDSPSVEPETAAVPVPVLAEARLDFGVLFPTIDLLARAENAKSLEGCLPPPIPIPPVSCQCGGCCECNRCWDGDRLVKQLCYY